MRIKEYLKFVGVLLLFSVLLFFSGFFTCKYCSKQPLPRVDTLIVEKWVHDTIKVASAPKVLVRTDTAWLREVRDSVIRDTVWSQVEVPITQTKYEGEHYKATVEGYKARLVDIQVATKTMVVTQKLAAPRWSLGVSAGPMVGYGYTPKGWQPVAGAGIVVGVQYRF